VKFLRGNIANIKEDTDSKDLTIRVEDTLSQEILELKADLVVLSTAMEPAASTDELVKKIQLDRTADGFLKEFHARLNPIDTKIPGIYLCGAAQGPKSIDESVASGRAAASSAAIPMIKKVHEIAKLDGIIDQERCSGCGLCIKICPYHAIKMEYDVVKVDTILCRGCGM
ncbi:MAG: 4Fe-4S binding protein, partial [Candidatus Helarchaeota archaeon]|nr:4Fe-4S binding protein [Candidatus Helarchaeota archaeon]